MNPILARFQDQPALIEESQGAWLEACLSQVMNRLPEIERAAASGDQDDFWRDGMSWVRPYVVKNGILHIPVKGVLLNDFPYALGNWATGYEYIWAAVKRGVDDSDVKGIALIINSGGGLVSGNWDCVDRIYSVRDRKPMRSFAAEHAYSAAYNIFAAPGKGTGTVARTGGVGSIGVVVTHFEMSRMLDEAGITVKIIRSKPGKMEANPYEKLSEGAQERIQERVGEFHKQFVAMVARNRGMDEGAVDKTGALTFMAHQAIENGLADDIGAPDDAITAFEASLQQGEGEMAEITQAEMDAAVAAATAAAKADGTKEGSASAIARINAIIDSDAGKKRPTAALNAALKTSMSADEATAFLATLPEEKAVEPAPSAGVPAAIFTAAMDNTANPNVGANAGDDKNKNPADADRALIQSFGLAGFKDKE